MLSSSLVVLLCLVAVTALVVGCRDMAALELVRQVRGRLLVSMAVFAGAALAAWWVLWSLPLLEGTVFMISPGIAAAVGVCIFGLVPFRDRQATSLRSASLSPRTPGSVITKRTLAAPLVALTALTTALLTTGFTAGADGVTLPVASGAAVGPYPGWFWGGPILITAGALLAATALAIRRAVLIPAIASPETDQEQWRRTIGSTLGSILTCGLLLYLAEVSWTAGRSLTYASHWPSASNPLFGALGSVLAVTTPLIIVIAAAVLVHAGTRLRRPVRILTGSAGPA